MQLFIPTNPEEERAKEKKREAEKEKAKAEEKEKLAEQLEKKPKS